MGMRRKWQQVVLLTTLLSSLSLLLLTQRPLKSKSKAQGQESQGEWPAGVKYNNWTMEYLESVQRLRKAQVSATCDKYQLRGPSSQFLLGNPQQATKVSAFREPRSTLMYLEAHSLLYCFIHKAASTSWNKVFYGLAGVKVPEANLHEAAAYFRPPEGTDLQSLFSNSVSFTFVRNPFERIVSAFRDKFESGSKSNYMYITYAASILGLKVDKKELRNSLIIKDRPTFSQFVDYLLRTEIKDYNDHWYPFWLQCHLCDQSFLVLGKFESLAEDTRAIQELSGLREGAFPWANKKDTGQEVGLQYFRQIDLARTRQLYETYRIDFEMFQYDVSPYFELFQS